MIVTIIPEERRIRRDNNIVTLTEWPFLDANIHAIQWDGQAGEIEYKGTPPPENISFDSVEILTPYLTALDEYLSNIPPTPPSENGPDYYAFWDALLTSTVYSSIRSQSMTSLPMNTLATEFIALLGDAKAGSPNESAIQDSMSAIFTTGTFTAADVAEFTAALAVGNLEGIYNLI